MPALIYKDSHHTTPEEKIEGAAGKASRMINDYNAGPFTWVDVDTEEERRLAEFNAGSQAVQDILNGSGYLERDTDPTAKLIPDQYAAVKGDSIAKLNILQPDLNFKALDADGDGVIEEHELEAELHAKNFGIGAGPPFGTDPLDAWYGKPDY